MGRLDVDVDDTIVAIASPPGSGQRGIIRVSGPATLACIANVFVADDERSIDLVATTCAIRGRAKLEAGLELPGQLLLWPTRRSYTRQPTAEFHTLGSAPLLQMVLSAICQAGARLARPGEFTLRAFLSGRIDLTQAEAVLAVIDSEGDQQLETALQQLAGGLAGPLGAIKQDLMGTLAELEAGLDFVEEDIEFISNENLIAQLKSVREQLKSIENQISSRELTSLAVKVVLDGEPNSGKSSLFNALVESDLAIVTNVAGTTTDFITCDLVVNQTPIELIDTAGFENRDDSVGGQAQRHRAEQHRQSELSLLCIDATGKLSSWETEQLKQADQTVIVVLTKQDRLPPDSFEIQQRKNQIQQAGFHGPIAVTSSETGYGMLLLKDQIAISILEGQRADQTVVSSTILRASESLRHATESVASAAAAAEFGHGEEIVAAEIREALEGLSQIVGMVYTDDILDLVFGRFCIGK